MSDGPTEGGSVTSGPPQIVGDGLTVTHDETLTVQAREADPEPPVAERREPLPFDTSVAHPARVYDYWLGGKDNFAPDREAARKVAEFNPGIIPGVRANRAFLTRAVRLLATEMGIDQFLDLGTGLPSAHSVHEVAQAENPQAKIVYVDNDPIVLVHAHALLTGTPGTVAYIDADIRNAGAVLREAGQTLDFNRPIAVLLLMTLQFVMGEHDPYALVRTLMDAAPSGSFLVVSHPASDISESANEGTKKYNEMVSSSMARRSHDEILRFFDGLELVEPGLVVIPQWRPDADDAVPGDVTIPAYAGVGRKP